MAYNYSQTPIYKVC